MPDGSVFKFSSKIEDATRELQRGVTDDGSLANATSVAFTKEGTTSGEKVNSIGMSVMKCSHINLRDRLT